MAAVPQAPYELVEGGELYTIFENLLGQLQFQLEDQQT